MISANEATEFTIQARKKVATDLLIHLDLDIKKAAMQGDRFTKIQVPLRSLLYFQGAVGQLGFRSTIISDVEGEEGEKAWVEVAWRATK